MASTDATAIPVKNQAYRVTFPLFDADGDLVTGATGLDSEVSKDAGTFADCTSEATEIATASGMYFLDLTSTEMNADTVAIIVKTTSSGAKTTPIILYPQEAGDLKVNVTYWNSTAVSSPATAGIPDVNVKNIDNDAASAAGTVTFPNATLASTANITAGTMTTVTNLTTNNDKTGYSLASGPLDAAGVRTAVGLASANLDTQIGTLATAAALGTVDNFIDTEVAAILAAVDTEVAAIKAKTDLIPASPAAVGSAMTLTSGERDATGTALLKLSWVGITGEARYSLLNAGRKLLNKWSIVGAIWSIFKEDGTTAAFTETLTTDAAADPVTGTTPV